MYGTSKLTSTQERIWWRKLEALLAINYNIRMYPKIFMQIVVILVNCNTGVLQYFNFLLCIHKDILRSKRRVFYCLYCIFYGFLLVFIYCEALLSGFSTRLGFYMASTSVPSISKDQDVQIKSVCTRKYSTLCIITFQCRGVWSWFIAHFINHEVL